MPQKRGESPRGPNTLNISPVSQLTQKVLTSINIFASSNSCWAFLCGHGYQFKFFHLIKLIIERTLSHQFLKIPSFPGFENILFPGQYFNIDYAQYWKVNKLSPHLSIRKCRLNWWFCGFGWNMRKRNKTKINSYALISHMPVKLSLASCNRAIAGSE